MIPAFDELTGGLPPGDHPAPLDEVAKQFGFTPKRKWLIQGLRKAVKAFWEAGIEEIYIDGSFCTSKAEPGDIDGYWVEPDPDVYDASILTGSISNWFLCHTSGSENGACGRNMVLSSSSIRPWTPRRMPVFRCSFEGIARAVRAALFE